MTRASRLSLLPLGPGAEVLPGIEGHGKNSEPCVLARGAYGHSVGLGFISDVSRSVLESY